MSRGRNGEMRNVNSAMDTINAAATAIASAESRVPPPAVQKRRWSSCWSVYWCFGSQKNTKRFGHAVLVPEPAPAGNGTAAPPPEHASQPPAIRIPFVAPPSSPASFLPSEPQSALQSPAGSVGFNSISANMYSPGGPRSIFAIGPYAHETQLVTPPVFSTYTTEPSTAPFTPPPESVHLTTPSSPEVPFAQLLDPIHRNGDVGPRFTSSHYEFQSYLLQPGSPVGPLISPGSAVSGSGTSSPFPDRDFPGGVSYFPDIRYGVNREWGSRQAGANREWGSQQASGSVTPDAVQWGSRQASGSVTPDAVRWGSWQASGSVTPDAFRWGSQQASGSVTPDAVRWGSQQASGSVTPDTVRPKSRDGFLLDRQDSTVSALPSLPNGHRSNDALIDHRVSFELTAEDVVRCVEKKPTSLPKALQNSDGRDHDNANTLVDDSAAPGTTERASPNREDGQRHQKQRAASLGSIKEFNFDHVNGVVSDDKPSISSNWWANEKVIGNEGEVSKNWSFFPMIQPGVS